MDLIIMSFLEGEGVIIEKIFYCFISCFGPFAALFFTLKKLIILAAGGYLPPPFVEFSIKIINFFFDPFPKSNNNFING